MNPFLELSDRNSWGPGSFEMALSLVEALKICAGMRVLEIGGGSGQIAATIAKYWNVNVVTLEPWTDGIEIQKNAIALGVNHQVLGMKLKAQEMPFASGTFDAVISIGSFEMIGDERPAALKEIIRVAKPNAYIGIAEPMCQPEPMPIDMVVIDEQYNLGFRRCFRSLEWNCELFRQQGLSVVQCSYFPSARDWWIVYRDQKRISEAEQQLITLDKRGWISLGMVVGQKRSDEDG
ncbi:Methyltransferase domain-containing protein [Paenibacillus sp. 1_12]|uniref:class I SAM-dependent methyltransferase n=1 Tax=Paenibacillus sp. 1_12 TaxID=1566278 RepID=UPI0008E40AA9|nr:class I SAM-dependent methyltransferase [Paenibacillus sp. 1_12]SFL06514.1 Methyltransferase domain-containing protein [Paenibacillus sp. 1_12]